MRDLLTNMNPEIEAKLLGTEAEFSQLSSANPFRVDQVRSRVVRRSTGCTLWSSLFMVSASSLCRLSARLFSRCQRAPTFWKRLQKQEFLWNCLSTAPFSLPSSRGNLMPYFCWERSPTPLWKCRSTSTKAFDIPNWRTKFLLISVIVSVLQADQLRQYLCKVVTKCWASLRIKKKNLVLSEIYGSEALESVFFFFFLNQELQYL